jgi:hypothetical protein
MVLTECVSVEASNAEQLYVALSALERIVSNPDLYMIACARRPWQELVFYAPTAPQAFKFSPQACSKALY